jgi:signal transduction histidine kinase
MRGEVLRVLLVEDNPGDADLLRETLADAGAPFDLAHVDRLSAALERAAEGDRDVVLLDLSLPDASDLVGVRQLHRAFPSLPIIVLTGSRSERVGPGAVAVGAQDYLVKGIDAPALLRAVRYAIERQQYVERARLLAEERTAHANAERERTKAQLLAEASKALFASLDCDANLASLARLLALELKALCAVEVAEGAGRRLVACAHQDAEKDELARRLWDRWNAGAGVARGSAAVMRSGEPEVHTEVPEAWQPAALDGARGAGPDVALRSLLVVPMRSPRRTFGAIALASGEPGRFRAEDLELTEEIGRRAGIAIENSRLYREAQEAVALRDEFLAIASHELRTPLTALLLHLQSAVRRRASDEHLVAKIDRAIASGERLSTLIKSLMDVSHISAGRFALEKEDFDLASAVREVAERYRANAAHAGCELTVRADPAIHGRWDKLRVEQALGNLLSNAIKYAPAKPIDVRAWEEPGLALVCVADAGSGIRESELSRIFERFVRGQSARHLGGMGLGLYITRQIAEAHGGALDVANGDAGGAHFTLRLPRP